jgi:hypothetical protein
MAITNDLPSVFCWVSQMASSHISSYISLSKGRNDDGDVMNYVKINRTTFSWEKNNPVLTARRASTHQKWPTVKLTPP